MAVDMFNAPIPGESLTAEMGGRPWEQPAQYNTVEEALDYYITQMSSDQFFDQLVDVLEMGVPVTTLADIIQTSSMMKGIHNLDVGILITPALIEMIMLMGDIAKVDYESGLEDKQDKERNSNMTVMRAKQELKEELSNKEDTSTEEVVGVEEEPLGLMSRRNK